MWIVGTEVSDEASEVRVDSVVFITGCGLIHGGRDSVISSGGVAKRYMRM